MIKNNKHDTCVKNTPDIIHDVIVKGSHTLTSTEAAGFIPDQFYADYDTHMTEMNFPSVPLQVVTKNNQTVIEIHPKFYEQLDATFGHSEFEAYKYLYDRRFEELEHEKQNDADEHLGEFQENYETPKTKSPASQSFEAEGAAELEAARQKNADYAGIHMKLLFEDNHGDYPDNYGWIENRSKLFLQQLDGLCEYYALPRLAIKLDEDGIPAFNASTEKADEVRAMYHERKAQVAELIERTSNPRDQFNESLNRTMGFAALRTQWAISENQERGFETPVDDKGKRIDFQYRDLFVRNDVDISTKDGGHILDTFQEDLSEFKPIGKTSFPTLILS